MKKKNQKISQKSCSENSVHDSYNGITNILIVLALPEERKYFHSVISNRKNWEARSERQLFLAKYHSGSGVVNVWVKTLQGMGHIEAVLGTTSAISAIMPSIAVMVGIAGSLRPNKVGLGDVVVSNHAKYYASDKVLDINGSLTYKVVDGSKAIPGDKNYIYVDGRDKFLDNSIFRYERDYISVESIDDLVSEFEGNLNSCQLTELNSETLPEKMSDIATTIGKVKVHMGWLLGSHHVVDSGEYRDYLVEKDDCLNLDIHRQKGDSDRVKWPSSGEILAVDMESYGFLRSVEKLRNTSPRHGGVTNLAGGIVIRGISDLCENKGMLDSYTKDSVREIAVHNATEVALNFIEKLNYDVVVSN
ncbi:MAG: hypothetical protein R3E57_07275 [Porticoccaceae bacterium]